MLAGAQEIRAAFQGVAGARLMMNDRVDLALLAGFDGVHVGQGDLSPTDVRRVMRAVWTHSSRKAKSAQELGHGAGLWLG